MRSLWDRGNTADSAIDAIDASYKEDVTDEFVVPTVIVENGEPVATLKENDSVISITSDQTVQERSHVLFVMINSTV